MADRGDCAP